VKKLALLAMLVGAFLPAHSAWAEVCGLSDSKPLWIDYAEGSVGFRDTVFARPGIVAATSGAAVPQALRNGGARTVYWHMKLGALVGTTTAPADSATIDAAAQKLFDTAAASSGCSTPLIALNELNGASTRTPWTTTNARYRRNVLDLLRALQSRGARPFLLVNSFPHTDGEAADWWRQAAQVADLVPPAAPWLGNRTSGFALAADAPAALFRLPATVASLFTTGLGSYAVTPWRGAAARRGALCGRPSRDPHRAGDVRTDAGIRGRRSQTG
jgi:hypothetical protein